MTAIYGQNLFWAIIRNWIKILTSNFVSWYLKIKTYDILSRSSNSRWPTDRHIWSKPILVHNSLLDWDIDFKFCVLVPQNNNFDFLLRSSDSRWPTDRHICSKPILVLDWDNDFKFIVLVEILWFPNYWFFREFHAFLNSNGHFTFEKI